MTSEILGLLVKANLAAGLAILAVLALRLPLRPLIGPRLGYGLWLAVPLAAVASLLPARQITAKALPALPLDTASQTAIDWFIPNAPALQPAAAPLDLTVLALIVWAIGATCAVILVLWMQEKSLIRLGRLTPEPGNPRLFNAGNSGFGPAVIGALRPFIVVPADFKARFNERERAVVLAHEQVHLARSDARINALVVLMQCLNWFNPLVHIAARLVRIDQELACDAAVMARYPEARRSYAEAMLKTQLATAPLPLGCYWPARSENPLKERLAMLRLKAPGPVRRLFGAASVAALTLAAGYAAWTATPAVAQPPVVTQGAVGSALAAPPQAKVAAPPTAPTVKAGAGGGPSSPAEQPLEIIGIIAATGEVIYGPPPRPKAAPPTGDLPPALPLSELADKARASTYSGDSPLLLSGTLAAVQYVNEGAVFMITDKTGKTWGVLGGPSNTLIGRGLVRSTLPPGTQMIVRGYQAIDGVGCANSCVTLGRDITMGDGTRYYLPQTEGEAGLGAALSPATR